MNTGQGHYHIEDGLHEKQRSRKTVYLYSALVLLLLVAAGVGIGVAVSRRDNGDTAGQTPSPGLATDSSNRDSQAGEAVPETGLPSDGTVDGIPPGTPGVPPPTTTPTTTPTAPPTAPATAPPTTTPATTPVIPAVGPAPTTAIAPAAPTAPLIPAVGPAPAIAVTPTAVAPVGPPALFPTQAPNTWMKLPDVPLPMGEVGAGILTLANNPYYVIAGEHPREEVAKNGVTMILDLSTGEWYTATKRPSIGNHHAAEVINNKLYLFGGLSGGEQDLQVGTLVPGSAGPDIQWKMGAPLPFASGSAATALIGGKVYYCGGIDKANTMTLDDCALYDPVSNTWSAGVASMPAARNHAATCTDGKKMYVFGGRSGRNIVGEGFGETQIYDPASNTWALGAPLPVARGGMGKAVYHEGKCYVFGGEVWEEDAPSVARKISAARVSFATDIYTIATDSWSSGKDMPIGLHGMFPIKYGTEVVMGSGGTQAAYSQSAHAYVYTL